MTAGTTISEALSTVAFYVFGKALLRTFTGSKPDPRGWGFETYFSAWLHQLATIVFAALLVASHAESLDAWLVGPWTTRGESQRPERLFLLMQATEMATDMCRDHIYPGFGRTYLYHHVATLCAAVAALFLAVPVGGVILFAACMEAGGMVLNTVSLYPPAMAAWRRTMHAPGRAGARSQAKPPSWLLDMRALCFSSSRVMAALVLGKTTLAAMAFDSPPWIALAFAWAILAVNVSWVVALLKAFGKGSSSKGDAAFVE